MVCSCLQSKKREKLKGMKLTKPDIFHYLNYRNYLGDFYQENKERDPSFSYRYLAQRMKASSPNYLKLIIDGDRRLTETYLEPLVQVLELSEAEKTYLRLLVEFDDLEDLQKKDELLEKLRALKPGSQVHELSDQEMNVLEDWSALPLIELITHDLFTGPLDEKIDLMAEKMQMTPSDIRRLLKRLVKAGFLEQDAKHQWKKTHRNQNTKDEIANYYVQRYHVLNLQQAATKVFQQKLSEREYSSRTFRATEETIQELKKKIKAFNSEIIELLDAPRLEGEDVYQLNFQLFRLTKSSKE